MNAKFVSTNGFNFVFSSARKRRNDEADGDDGRRGNRLYITAGLNATRSRCRFCIRSKRRLVCAASLSSRPSRGKSCCGLVSSHFESWTFCLLVLVAATRAEHAWDCCVQLNRQNSRLFQVRYINLLHSDLFRCKAFARYRQSDTIDMGHSVSIKKRA